MKWLFTLLALFILFTNQISAHEVDPNIPEVSGEHIESFNSDITINPGGTIDVTESILYDFDTLDKHGIYRNIPFTKRDENNKRVDLTFENFTVTNEYGENVPFKKSTENEQIVLKIGDPDKTISGEHLYAISYRVSGAIGYFEDHDELYWNVTGNSWEVPIRYAAAHIIVPQKAQRDKIQLACYVGAYGATENLCTTEDDAETIHIQSRKVLPSGEGLTMVIGLEKNLLSYLPPTPYVSFWETTLGKITIAAIIMVAALWYLILPIALIFQYFKHGRDPYVGPSVTSWFDPPVNQNGRSLSPTETGGLLDESVDVKDIFAAIIDLARRGYLKIKEDEKKKFTLIYTNKPKAKDTLLPFEKDLLDGIFRNKKEVKLKDVKFYKTVQDVEKKVYESLVSDEFFPHNPKTVRTKYYVLGVFSLISFNLVLASLSFFLGKIMPRKTLYGAQQANVGRGIKNFMKSQERQINFQGDKQMLFEKLLPFAIAFGVEKNWAERFKDIDLKNPDWYQGASTSHFTTAAFISSLNNSQSSFATSSTPPSSSSSSGFGGGGFSGGGGGGGGGGSW